jgi:hypothetical protein
MFSALAYAYEFKVLSYFWYYHFVDAAFALEANPGFQSHRR